MLTGIAATTIGALPIALRLFMANLDNVSGAEFIGPMIAYAVLFVAVLAIRLVQLAHARETDVDCMIARASLVPGGLNIIAFTVSPFLDGGAQ